MEIGLHPGLPTYAGGLGVLAGDTLLAAADMNLPLVAVTLLHRKGYFYQRLDSTGWQWEEPVNWIVEDFLEDTGQRVSLVLEGRTVHVRAWRYEVRGDSDRVVPVYFLDTDLPENHELDREITHYLYGGDLRYRLRQEAVLGLGGVRLLRTMGYARLQRFHMNEGHASLLTLELLREVRERAGREFIEPEDLDAVRRQCVFTTHTPVPAGHDQFPLELVDQVLGDRDACGIHDPICHENRLNMTFLALTLSGYINGVAKKHGAVAQDMFGGYKVDAITNGVHVPRWVAPPFARLFDQYIPGWREDPFSLRYALSIPEDRIDEAHRGMKDPLIQFINRTTNAGFDRDCLTLGFARRAATYKRGDLVLDEGPRLRRIAREAGRFQIVFAGKAHPQDKGGKQLIQRILQAARELRGEVPIAYLPNYDLEMAKDLVAGVDLWLNTPEPPQEASGTSGMKAALNGVPTLSVLDGWWIEGCIEGVTGWAIGEDSRASRPATRQDDADSLTQKLESAILPLFYHDRERWIEIMRHAIALNGSFFNTQRMLQQYVLKAYFP